MPVADDDYLHDEETGIWFPAANMAARQDAADIR
jgi:hypothetical protein